MVPKELSHLTVPTPATWTRLLNIIHVCTVMTSVCPVHHGRRTAYIIRDNTKAFTSVGLPFKDIILFSKTIYVFDVIYVKSDSIRR